MIIKKTAKDVHVSIVGSCVLRDIFNSKFVPNYAEHFKVDSYFARTSIPSIVSKAYDYDINALEEKFNPLKFEYHYTECAKCMLSILENNNSDYLLIDFYADVFYGTYEYEHNYYSGWSFSRMLKMGIIDAKAGIKKYNFENNAEEYFELWCKSFDKFVEHAKKHFPETKIVINGIKGSNQITQDGNVVGIQQPKLDVDKMNELWERMDRYCEEKHKIPVIHYEKKYTLNPDYIYGLNHEFVHFHPEYYTDAFAKLAKMCTKKHEKQLSHTNLVRNSNFELGLKFWSLHNGSWLVEQKPEKCVLKSPKASKKAWKSIWCDPIEINGDGETHYTLSFDVNVKEKIEEPELALFGVRTFKRAVERKYQEAIFFDLISIPATDIKYGEDMRITYTFQPRGKFIRIAPHIKQDICDIEFSNIQLEKGPEATQYKQCTDDNNL